MCPPPPSPLPSLSPPSRQATLKKSVRKAAYIIWRKRTHTTKPTGKDAAGIQQAGERKKKQRRPPIAGCSSRLQAKTVSQVTVKVLIGPSRLGYQATK